MTELACPVCATPYQAGAATCAFCGVSLVEPEREAKAESEVETPVEVEVLVESTSETEASADIDEAGGIEAAPVDASEPAFAGMDESIAEDPPSPATEPEFADPGEIAAPPADPSEPASADPDGIAETPEIPGIPADSLAAPVGTPELQAKTPSFAKAAAASAAQRRAQRIEWSVVAGLGVLLLVQVVASDFDQLAASGTTRPWLQRACSVLHCTLPPWREPSALRMLQRDVRANPRQPGLLRISASFRNEARWAQPWPRLRITLSDADGRAIAARDFAANEYLGAKPTTNGIASGQVAGIAFDVVDPSPQVTAFTFEFR